MKKLLSMIVGGSLLLGLGGAPARADEPSLKQGLEEAGDAIADDTKDAAEKTGDEVKKGWHATERGVGDAMQKTGEGVDAAGAKVHKEGQ